MSQRKNLEAQLTRRSWIVLATAALSGCGGGGSGGSTAGMAPGTGGTGIYVQGSISGFGSVIINGIKLDDSAATVRLDGLASRSADLRLGMVAGVQGARSVVDATLGTANSIEVWSIAQGLVTSTQAGVFTVAGMTVQTDSATVLDGVSAVTQLVSGMRVVVWGLLAGTDGSHWRATRVAVVSATDTTVVSTGLVQVAGAQRTLNGLLLTGAAAGALADGALVRVQGALSAADGSLAVANAKLLSGDGLAARQGEAEIEGLVTAILSTTRFMLGEVEVDVSSVSLSGTSAQVTVGARLEVYGTWQVGVLKASKVELEDALTLQEVEIEAPIEAFTSLANFVVRGQRCDATGATISHGTAADLRVGVKVHIKGSKAGDVLMVTELELAS